MSAFNGKGLKTIAISSSLVTVDSPLTDTPKSRHMPNNGQ